MLYKVKRSGVNEFAALRGLKKGACKAVGTGLRHGVVDRGQ